MRKRLYYLAINSLGYYNGWYGYEVTLFGVTFFWRHKDKEPVGREQMGRLSWERY